FRSPEPAPRPAPRAVLQSGARRGPRNPSLGDAPAEELDERSARLDAFGGEGGLEIRGEGCAELRARLCPCREPADLGSRAHELLCRFDPSWWGRRQQP